MWDKGYSLAYRMKILSIVGARPQFIKASPVSHALRQQHEEILVHTGQHYDRALSAIFFEEMGIPKPDYNLGVGSGSHGQQTAQMLIELEQLMQQEKPDWVLVYGDTNSTLAGAIAAAKLHIPIAHVEAGLRSFNRAMPEEINRILTDHVSTLLLCPTQTAVSHLSNEGITDGVHLVGDVMYDAMLSFLPKVDETAVLSTLGVTAGEYVLATVHRANNTDDAESLTAVFNCLALSPFPILLPAHPRTVAAMKRWHVSLPDGVQLIAPVSYLSMLALEKNARFIMTDSGGVQKEAYLLGVPCITLREETEWVETAVDGWNTIAGVDQKKVRVALSSSRPAITPPPVFGNGTAAAQITKLIR